MGWRGFFFWQCGGNRRNKHVLVDGVFQTLSSLELWLVRCLDLHWFTGTWIAARRSLAASDGERTEADQANFIALRKRLLDRTKYAFNGTRGIALRKAAGIGDCADQVILVHSGVPC